MNEDIPFHIKEGAYGFVTVKTSSKLPEEMEPEAIDAAVRALQTHKQAKYNMAEDSR